MQKMANTVNLYAAYIAAILFKPGNFIIRHYRAQLRLTPNE
jgi:hypothetical protein